MTDIRRTRLADALADHMMVESSCLCGEDDFTFADDWGRHLADVLLSLPDIAIVDGELRQEWCARHESGGGGIYRTEAEAVEFLDNFTERPPGVEDPGSGRYVGLEVRYVTEWKPAQRPPGGSGVSG